MTIGIDARSLEGPQTGVGRYLTNLIENWACLPAGMGCSTHHRFVLYFKKQIPILGILEKPCYSKKIIKAPFGIQSNALFQHYSLPLQASKDKIDVLFSPSYILPIRYKGKSAVTIHDISYELFPDNLSFANRILLRKASKFSAAKADAIITVSEFSRNQIISRYGVHPSKIYVTLLGADKKFLGAKKSKRIETVKNKLNIRDKFILSVGTLFNRRHADSLMKAFIPIGREFADYQLLVLGKNHTKPFINIDGMAEKINAELGRNAILRNEFVSDDDLAALYAGAEIFAYLSDYEGFGLPPLEAALAETPVITSDIPAIREVMGDAAIFIKNNADPDEISRAIKQLIPDAALKSRLIQEGFNRTKLYDWNISAKKTMEILEKIYLSN